MSRAGRTMPGQAGPGRLWVALRGPASSAQVLKSAAAFHDFCLLPAQVHSQLLKYFSQLIELSLGQPVQPRYPSLSCEICVVVFLAWPNNACLTGT